MGSDKTKEYGGFNRSVSHAIKMCDSAIHRDMYAGVWFRGVHYDMGGVFQCLSFG